MDLNIDFLRNLCNNKNILYSAHALERLQERGIFRKDILSAINNGEIIEQYPDDFPNPSCLIFGNTTKNIPIHIVCGCNNEILTIITAYYPNENIFESDLKTRKEKKQ